MDLTFILVRPKYPSNLGSTARAMRTMGFEKLAIVDPQTDPLHERAVKTAKHSADILEQAVIFETMGKALQSLDLSIATTNKLRKQQSACWSSKNLAARLIERDDAKMRLGILFGPEDTGLTNAEVDLCDVICSVPTATQNPSLNLAQAVMVLAYELSEVPLHVPIRRQHQFEAGTPQNYRNLKNELSQILEKIGLTSDGKIYKKVLDRVEMLNKTDLHLMHEVKNRLSKLMEGSPQ